MNHQKIERQADEAYAEFMRQWSRAIRADAGEPTHVEVWHHAWRAALAAAPVQPVAGQSQFAGEGEWSECAVEHVTAVLAAPHEWSLDYKVRYLYAAAPPPAQAQEDVRKPLAEEEIERLAEVHGSDIDGLARTNP